MGLKAGDAKLHFRAGSCTEVLEIHGNASAIAVLMVKIIEKMRIVSASASANVDAAVIIDECLLLGVQACKDGIELGLSSAKQIGEQIESVAVELERAFCAPIGINIVVVVGVVGQALFDVQAEWLLFSQLSLLSVRT